MSNLAEQGLIPLRKFKPLKWAGSLAIPDKIQYACGLNPIDGWLNVDFFDAALMWNFKHIGGVPHKVAASVYKHNLVDRHPFPDNSFQYAFCEDFIEHLEQKDAILFLSEVLRTLKAGGVLRLACPGLSGVMASHFAQPNYDGVIKGHQDAYIKWGHRHFFTHDSLATMTTSLGFQEYRVCSYHESSHHQLRNLETRAEQEHYKINIYAELTK